jgi:hypothetical protein
MLWISILLFPSHSLLEELNDDFSEKHRRMNEVRTREASSLSLNVRLTASPRQAIGRLIEDYSMVAFLPFDISVLLLPP